MSERIVKHIAGLLVGAWMMLTSALVLTLGVPSLAELIDFIAINESTGIVRMLPLVLLIWTVAGTLGLAAVGAKFAIKGFDLTQLLQRAGISHRWLWSRDKKTEEQHHWMG